MQIKQESRSVSIRIKAVTSLYFLSIFFLFFFDAIYKLVNQTPIYNIVECLVIFSFSVRHMRERESDNANSAVWASSGLQVSEEAYISSCLFLSVL